MKKEKRIVSVLLAFIMLTVLYSPVNVMAANELSTTMNISKINKFGNIPLMLKCTEIFDAGYNYGDVLNISYLNKNLELPLCSNYSDVDTGNPAIFAMQTDEYVQLAISMGDFATDYGIAQKNTSAGNSIVWTLTDGITDPVKVSISMSKAAGYYNEYMLHKISYTNNRTDYPHLTDEQFANFRMITTSGIGQGRLYRSASPVNPKFNRNKYADAAYKKAGVNVIMNLADDDVTVKSHPDFSSSYYSGQKFIALNMGVDFASDDFNAKLAQGLRFFAENPGVYGIHCTEGKDRAGFVVALIECLAGAGYDEMVSDFMTSYYNYYGITPGDPKYEPIANSNINKNLAKVFGVSDLKKNKS